MTTPNLNLALPVGNDIARLFSSTVVTPGEDENNDSILRTYTTRASLPNWIPQLTAAITNPNLGADGTQFGRFLQFPAGLVIAYAVFIADGAGVDPGSGTYEIDPPVAVDPSFHIGDFIFGEVVGSVWLRDNSNSANARPAVLRVLDSTSLIITAIEASVSNMNANSPFSLAQGDAITAMMMYRGVV